jgi:hypothetical protein
MATQLDRITFTASFHAGEHALDGEAVSGYFPLDQYNGSIQSTFRAGAVAGDLERYWVGYSVTDYLSGAIHYAQSEDLAVELSRKIARSYLLEATLRVVTA